MVRSKRWVALADHRFWADFASRVVTRPSTHVIHGGTETEFRDACRTWSDNPPLVTAHYVGVQPGLDVDQLLGLIDAEDFMGARLAETIGACAGWVGGPNSTVSIIGS